MNIYEKPKPKHSKNTNKPKEIATSYAEKEQLAFDDLPKSTKNFGSVLEDLATHLVKSKK